MIKRLLFILSFILRFSFNKVTNQINKIYDLIYILGDRLGGIFIKLIQFLSLRTDIFPDHQKLRFLCFYDQVTGQPLDIQKVLIKELGLNKLKHFIQIDTIPFAAGTFGQVYKAKLLSGKKVAIKVKRLNINNNLHCARETYRAVIKTINEKRLINEEDIKYHALSQEEAIEHLLDWSTSLAEEDIGLYHKLEINLN